MCGHGFPTLQPAKVRQPVAAELLNSRPVLWELMRRDMDS